jgi:hypothetical protein
MQHADLTIRPFALRIPEQLLTQIQTLAKQEKRSANAQIVYLLEEALAAKQEPKTRARRRNKPATA